MKLFCNNLLVFILVALFGAILFFAPVKSHAQAIVPTVTVNLDNCPDQFKPMWKDAATFLTRYMMSPPWNDNSYDYTVPLKVAIWVSDVVDNPADRTYKCYILVSNGTDVQFSDKRWQFPLPDFKSIQRGGAYDPMLSVLDFYTYLVLVAEFDKWEVHGGERWFTPARGIAAQGKFDTRYVLGWNERNDLLNQLASRDNKLYRMFRYYAYTGEYMTANNQKDANIVVDSAYVLLPKLKPEDRKQFLSTNAVILADAAFRLNNILQLETLAAIDTSTSTLVKDRLDKLGKK